MPKISRRMPVVLFTAILVATQGAVLAQDFRIESSVFVGKEKEPSSESLTLFRAGVVYDFALPEYDEVTIFDPARARFVLLDNTLRIKTVLTTVELLDVVEELKTMPAFTKQSYLLDPKFKEQHEPETGWLTLSGDQITYRAKTLKPEDPEAAHLYRKFADWYARLNAGYKGNFHTLARLDLNKSLDQKGFVPQEVELTVAPRSFVGKKLEVRSRHLYNWKLSETDQKRIEKAGVGLADYQEVPLAEFKKPAIANAGKRK